MSTAHPWVMRSTPSERARLRLFCFPYAGGGASVYRKWQAELPSYVELCAIQLPGRENRMREPAVTSMNALLPMLAEALAPLLDLPYAFYGHSMGALTAFELTRHLSAQKRPLPVRLFLSGRRSVQCAPSDIMNHKLSEPDFIARLRRLNGTPEEVLNQPELLALILPLLRADFQLCETYEYMPGPPLSCPIAAFGGDRDADVNHDSLLAWKEHTTGDFTCQLFPGDHFFVHSCRMPLVNEIVRLLSVPA